MKIYFDESGQTGCVLLKEDLLNFREQPTFAIGALVVKNNKDEERLLCKYKDFKKKFNITTEIKGSDLLTREHNQELDYIVNNLLDKTHYYILLYDKRFYISTLLFSLLGFEYQQELPTHFYQQASFLSKQNDDFFIQYLKYIENPTINNFKMYLKYLINYNYEYNQLEEKLESKCFNDFMTFGCYDNLK